MANKKFIDFPSGTPTASSIVLFADPSTGVISKCTVAEMNAVSGGGATTLTAPTLSATVISSTQINLSWNNVANESSYQLQRSPAGANTWADIATPAADATSFNNTGLTASTAYDYRIRAVGNGTTFLTSAWSNTASGTTSAGGGSYDADAQAFFDAIGASLAVGSLTDTQVKNATNQLVVDWKAISGLWAKTKVLMPYVGSTNNSMKRNLKNPADTDAAFRQVFNGSSITYSQNGLELETVDFDDSYISTKFNPSLHATSANEFAYGFYLKYSDTGGTRIYASAQTSGTQLIYLEYNPGTSIITSDLFDGNQRITASGAMTELISTVRQSSTLVKLFRNGTSLGSNTGSHSAALPNQEFVINAFNNNGTISGSKPQSCYGMFYIVDGVVSDADMTAISAAVNTFVTALNRQA